MTPLENLGLFLLGAAGFFVILVIAFVVIARFTE